MWISTRPWPRWKSIMAEKKSGSRKTGITNADGANCTVGCFVGRKSRVRCHASSGIKSRSLRKSMHILICASLRPSSAAAPAVMSNSIM